MKMCERCGVEEAVKKTRFCKDCTKIVKSEMVESGYLIPEPPKFPFGPTEERGRKQLRPVGEINEDDYSEGSDP